MKLFKQTLYQYAFFALKGFISRCSFMNYLWSTVMYTTFESLYNRLLLKKRIIQCVLMCLVAEQQQYCTPPTPPQFLILLSLPLPPLNVIYDIRLNDCLYIIKIDLTLIYDKNDRCLIGAMFDVKQFFGN